MSVLSPIGQFSYVHLVEPYTGESGLQKPKRQLNLVFDQETDISVLKDEVRRVIREKFPNGNVPPNARLPFRSGSEKPDTEGYKPTDTFVKFWKAGDRGPVPCRDAGNKEIAATEVYAGARGRVLCHAFWYDSVSGGLPGVSFSLDAVQKVSDGDPIGYAPVDAEAAFAEDPVSVSSSSSDDALKDLLG